MSGNAPDQFDCNPPLLCGYIGKSSAFDDAIERFALVHAEQDEVDWTARKAAVESGRVQVIRE